MIHIYDFCFIVNQRQHRWCCNEICFRRWNIAHAIWNISVADMKSLPLKAKVKGLRRNCEKTHPPQAVPLLWKRRLGTPSLQRGWLSIAKSGEFYRTRQAVSQPLLLVGRWGYGFAITPLSLRDISSIRGITSTATGWIALRHELISSWIDLTVMNCTYGAFLTTCYC